MANVPYTGVPTVEPSSGLPDDYQHIQPTAAEGLQKFGEGIDKLASGIKVAGDYYNRVASDNGFNQYQKLETETMYGTPGKMVQGPDGSMVPDTGFFGQRGASAMSAWPVVSQQLEAARTKIRNGLPAGSQLDFENASRSLYTRTSRMAAAHADEQSFNYYKSVNKDTVENGLNAISANPLDEVGFQNNLHDIINANVKNAHFDGADQKDPVVIKNATETGSRIAWTARIEAAAARDPAAAYKMLQDNQAIIGVNYDALAAKIRPLVADRVLNDRVYKGLQPPGAQAHRTRGPVAPSAGAAKPAAELTFPQGPYGIEKSLGALAKGDVKGAADAGSGIMKLATQDGFSALGKISGYISNLPDEDVTALDHEIKTNPKVRSSFDQMPQSLQSAFTRRVAAIKPSAAAAPGVAPEHRTRGIGGDGGVDPYGLIPPKGEHGEDQISMFRQWNPDPIGNSDRIISEVHPDLQKLIAKARADHPGLNFVAAIGLRTPDQQAMAERFGWADKGSGGPDMAGHAIDLWPVENGQVKFDRAKQMEIRAALDKASQELGVPLRPMIKGTPGLSRAEKGDPVHFQLANPGDWKPTSGAAHAPGAGTPLTPHQGGMQGWDVMERSRNAIASIEGNYNSIGPATKLGRGLGRYQVMEANLPQWSQEALGRVVSSQEFMSHPEIQDQIFNFKFAQAIKRYGDPLAAASVWFTGQPNAGPARDVLGTSANQYVRQFAAAYYGGAPAGHRGVVGGGYGGRGVVSGEDGGGGRSIGAVAADNFNVAGPSLTKDQVASDAQAFFPDDPEMQRLYMQRGDALANEINTSSALEREQARAKSEAAAAPFMAAIVAGTASPNIMGEVSANKDLLPSEKEALRSALSASAEFSQANATAEYGRDFWPTFKAVIAPPGDPTHISELAQILRRVGPDLNMAGAAKLATMLRQATQPDQASINEAKHAILEKARHYLDFSQDFAGAGIPGTKDPTGPGKFGTYTVQFLSSFDKYMAKEGADPWEFLRKTDKEEPWKALRTPGEIALAKMQATESVDPSKMIHPPAPQGVDQAGWTVAVNAPPMTKAGQPWPAANWVGALTTLATYPTKQVMGDFDEYFANNAQGYKAADILAVFGVEPHELPPDERPGGGAPTSQTSAAAPPVAVPATAAPAAPAAEGAREAEEAARLKAAGVLPPGYRPAERIAPTPPSPQPLAGGALPSESGVPQVPLVERQQREEQLETIKSGTPLHSSGLPPATIENLRRSGALPPTSATDFVQREHRATLERAKDSSAALQALPDREFHAAVVAASDAVVRPAHPSTPTPPTRGLPNLREIMATAFRKELAKNTKHTDKELDAMVDEYLRTVVDPAIAKGQQ